MILLAEHSPDIIITGTVILSTLAWSSFLNVLAHRLLTQKSLLEHRSSCPHCATQLAWYELIPLASQLFLKNKCRTCKEPISLLYPLIEASGAIIFTILWARNFGLNYNALRTISYPTLKVFGAQVLYASMLLVAVRTDLEDLVILRLCSLYAIPLWVAAAYTQEFIPISVSQSIAGALFGYGLPYAVGYIFKYFKNVDGIGEGDFELLGMIGAYNGVTPTLNILLIAALTGLMYGICFIIATGQKNPRIPFAPFLALGACIWLLT